MEVETGRASATTSTVSERTGRVQLPREIAELNLISVAAKIRDHHRDWTETRIRAAVEGYRYFLALCKFEPERPLVPAHDVDEVWHMHILFLEQYLADCQTVFGKVLYHYPYFGLQPEHAIRQYGAHLRDMLYLYRQYFGYVPPVYDGIEDEIAEALATGILTSERGLSGTMNLAHPANARWYVPA